MHILVTRPEPDANALRTRLEAMGHRVSVFPLLTTMFRDDAAIDLGGVSALVATSRNGLRALLRRPLHTQCLALPIFTVAREAHFKTVIEGTASARELVETIAHHEVSRSGTLLVLRPDEPAFDVSGALRQKGLTVREVTLYTTVPQDTLDPAVAAAIENKDMDAVLLMSPRSAATFTHLIQKAGLGSAARELAYLCLSSAVVGPLSPLHPVSIHTAVKPNLEEMLALVAVLASKSR
jgi:uroporphyrinogen-III synthase